MSRFVIGKFCFSLFLTLLLSWQTAEAQVAAGAENSTRKAATQSAARDQEKAAAIAETTRIVSEIIKDSFPELAGARISVRTFRSSSDYFRSRFSFSRFLTFRRLHYVVFVNPQVFARNAPEDGIRAIIAHELAHAAYYRRHNRFELLGLVGLLSNSFTARFERGADLLAIRRGYGAGLKDYRRWLYRNIPPKNLVAKKRDYFSPEEIDLILQATDEKPELFEFWRKNIPRDAAEINASSTGK